MSQSRTYENLSFCANVIAWLKACVLYVANGCEWDDTFEPFIRWSLQYDLYCKMQFFADAIDSGTATDRIGKRGPQNLLTMLPEEFTLEDAKRVRREQNLDNRDNKAMKMIRTWINRSYVIQNTVSGKSSVVHEQVYACTSGSQSLRARCVELSKYLAK